jgi:hypothetical protein
MLAFVDGFIARVYHFLDFKRKIHIIVKRKLAKMKTRKSALLAPVIILVAIFAISSASAQTWAPTSAPSNNWQSVVSSADGTKLLAVVMETLQGDMWVTRPDS